MNYIDGTLYFDLQMQVIEESLYFDEKFAEVSSI